MPGLNETREHIGGRLIPAFCLCTMLLTGVPGCVFFGARFLDESWDPVDAQASMGGILPVPLTDPTPDEAQLVCPFEYLHSSAKVGAIGIEINELSVGLALMRPWGDGNALAYVGGGLSGVRVGVTDAVADDVDWSAGGYAHLGVFGRTFGLELRYVFGTRLDLQGRERDADGLQVLVMVVLAGGY